MVDAEGHDAGSSVFGTCVGTVLGMVRVRVTDSAIYEWGLFG